MSRRLALASCGFAIGALFVLSSALATFAAAVAPAREGAYGKLRLDCDAKSSVLHVVDASAPAAKRDGQLNSTTIVWGALIRLGPKNAQGEAMRLGSSTSHYRCGRYEIRISGGYLNPRPMGEGGAIEFPVIEVRQGQDSVVPRTALAECEEALPRYGHFGECTKAWAESVSVAWNASTQKSQVTIRRAYIDRAHNDRTATDAFEVAARDSR